MVAAALGAAIVSPAAIAAAEADPPLYERDVLPILTQHCLKCHGREARKGGLDMRTFTLLSQGGESGPVLVAGSSATSTLLERITDGSMPPEGDLPLQPEQVDALRRWVDSGAHATDEGEAPVDPATEVSAEDREFWAFRPLARPEPPTVKAAERVRTPIDAFLLARLEERGLTFAPEANPRTLVRRAYFDLIGLPPSPDEVQAFLADTAEGAYDRLIDRLLASPHFGERWGRHWLDAAGYSDIVGTDNDATIIKVADGNWRYRDYVVRAFNDDKPFDQFLTEQLAGDELADWRKAEHFTPEMIDCLVATTFLRSGADDTNEAELNTADIRHGVLGRTVETVASNLLGLTVNCARCHSHKYDPIPQTDYYRLIAIFSPAFNPQAWLQPTDRAIADISPKEKAAAEEHNAAVRGQIDDLNRQIGEIRKPYRERLFDEKLASLPEAIRADTKAALQTAADNRTEVQKYLVEKFEKALAVSDDAVTAAVNAADKARIADLEAQSRALAEKTKSWGTIQAVYDVAPSSATYLLRRGNHDTPGPEVAPGFLSVLSSEGSASTQLVSTAAGETSGRRLAFARWLCEPETPAAALVARVMVNRAWQQLFGAGIVETADNFGHSGALPTHPELLDWLARDWIQNGYHPKQLVRQLMLSSAYRQSTSIDPPSSDAVPNPETIDPANQLLWRQRLRRLESELVRDAILTTSGKLDSSFGGPSVPVESRPDGSIVIRESELPTPSARWRRSLYIMARRNYHLSMLGVFDQPVIATNCTRRAPSAVVLQSLAMLNDDFVVEQSRHFADRVAASASQDQWVTSAFGLALSREPTSEEAAWCQDLLARQFARYRPQATDDAAAHRESLVHLCHMLLNTSEFLYVE